MSLTWGLGFNTAAWRGHHLGACRRYICYKTISDFKVRDRLRVRNLKITRAPSFEIPRVCAEVSKSKFYYVQPPPTHDLDKLNRAVARKTYD